MEQQKNQQETKIISKDVVQGRPLDFSFLKIQDIGCKWLLQVNSFLHLHLELKKENARSGKRKPIIETDDEEDQKKVWLDLWLCSVTSLNLHFWC